MKTNPGAQYEISVDGVPRAYRDRQDIALQTARFLKSRKSTQCGHAQELADPRGDRRGVQVGPLKLTDIPRRKYIGRRLGDQPTEEAEHFMRCPRCGGWMDCRDLARSSSTKVRCSRRWAPFTPRPGGSSYEGAAACPWSWWLTLQIRRSLCRHYGAGDAFPP